MRRWKDKPITCDICLEVLERNTEPVTTSGWYGNQFFSLRQGMAKCTLALCNEHKTRYHQLEQQSIEDRNPIPFGALAKLREEYKKSLLEGSK